MISFRDTSDVVRRALNDERLLSCIESFDEMMDCVCLTIAHGHLLARAEVDEGEYAFFFPEPIEEVAPEALDAALCALDDYAVRHQIPTVFLDLSEAQTESLLARYPLARAIPTEDERFILEVLTELHYLEREPSCVGERVTLRPPTLRDRAAYGRLLRDRERMRYFGYDLLLDRPDATDEQLVQHLLDERERRIACPFFIYEGERFVGELVLYAFRGRRDAELGVRLLPEALGRGLASDAVRIAQSFARDVLQLSRLAADVHCDNTAARRLFTHLLGEGTPREQLLHFSVPL